MDFPVLVVTMVPWVQRGAQDLRVTEEAEAGREPRAREASPACLGSGVRPGRRESRAPGGSQGRLDPRGNRCVKYFPELVLCKFICDSRDPLDLWV